MRHGTCFRRRLATRHAGAAPHSAVAEVGVVRRCHPSPVRTLLFIFVCITLAACSTPPIAPKLSAPRDIIPRERLSPDSTLVLRFERHDKSFHYDLINHSSRATVATASSAITPDDYVSEARFSGPRFRGTQDVVFATDGSGVIITENLSDGGPVLYYILIRRQPDRSFVVRYLQPPIIDSHNNQAGAYRLEHPVVAGLTSESITFYYLGARKSRSMSLDKVSSTATLQLL